jgi:sulfur relay (sulfurtransferase) DsrC/TusE family protein
MKNGNGHNQIYFSEVKFKVLKYIKNFIKQYGYSPTCKEIAKAHGYSRSRAGAICTDLYKMGLIYKGDSSHRKIRMTQAQIDSVSNLKINREYQAHG